MAERLTREYDVATTFIFDLWDFADARVRATVTPQAADAKLSKDGGTETNLGTTFAAEHGQWKATLTNVEMQFAQGKITLEDDAGGPVFIPRTIYIETYAGPSSQHGGLDATEQDAFAKAAGTVSTFVVDTGASTTAIPLSTLSPASAVDDQFVPRAVFFARDTTTVGLRNVARKVLSFNHSSQQITVDALPATPVSGDKGVIA